MPVNTSSGHTSKHTTRDGMSGVPSKDSGVDLLVTDGHNTKAVSLQVKFSKDFTTYRSDLIRDRLMAAGWWTHQEGKIKDSRADFWVFALPSFSERETSFIIIPPKELFRRLKSIHRREKKDKKDKE